MKLSLASLLVALCVWVLPHSASAQTFPTKIIYMRIEGPDGVIQGEITQQGFQGFHAVQAFSHEIISPRDAASGLPTGKRQHKPFTVVKLLNKGTPLLLKSMVDGQKLTVEIDLWAPTAAGAQVKVMTYKLYDASVAAIRPWSPNKNDPDTTNYNPAEEISFTYKTIEVTFINGDITAQDDWEAARDAAKAVKPAPAKP
jgi:type VI secretion system secreted protein Hcp